MATEQQNILDTKLELLFVTGDRVHLQLDKELLSECGFHEDSFQMFRVGDLRQYIFDRWKELVSERESHGSESQEDITNRPENVERVQLLHLGRRLDPNVLLKDLNLKLSHVLHIVVKPNGLDEAGLQDKSRFDHFASQFIRTRTSGNRRGSSSNTPVPKFVSSVAHKGSDMPQRLQSSTVPEHVKGKRKGSLATSSISEIPSKFSEISPERGSSERKSSDETQKENKINKTASANIKSHESSQIVASSSNQASEVRIQPHDSNMDISRTNPPSEGGGCCIIM